MDRSRPAKQRGQQQGTGRMKPSDRHQGATDQSLSQEPGQSTEETAGASSGNGHVMAGPAFEASRMSALQQAFRLAVHEALDYGSEVVDQFSGIGSIGSNSGLTSSELSKLLHQMLKRWQELAEEELTDIIEFTNAEECLLKLDRLNMQLLGIGHDCYPTASQDVANADATAAGGSQAFQGRHKDHAAGCEADLRPSPGDYSAKVAVVKEQVDPVLNEAREEYSQLEARGVELANTLEKEKAEEESMMKALQEAMDKLQAQLGPSAITELSLKPDQPPNGGRGTG